MHVRKLKLNTLENIVQFDRGENKRFINKLEKQQAKKLKMTRNTLSGSGTHKGDIRDDVVLIDSKFTYGKNQITIKKKDIQKIDLEAIDYNPPRIPALLMSINGFERMIISVEDFTHYIELIRKEEEND